MVAPVRPTVRPGTPPIPPARIAGEAGNPAMDVGYDRGHGTVADRPVQVVPVLHNPMDTQSPTQVEGITLRPARAMDAGTARATLGKMIADAKTWMADFPHQADGENAHVLTFFRGLISRQQARTTAAAHGQEIPEDAIEAAKHLPPPEAFTLRDVAVRSLAAIAVLERALQAANLALPIADLNAVDSTKESLESVIDRGL
jgi:hypothetical protein